MLMWSELISRPIQRSERSVQVKIARKIHSFGRGQKRNIDSQYEALAAGSTIGNTSSTTSVIKEPKKLHFELVTQISHYPGLNTKDLPN